MLDDDSQVWEVGLHGCTLFGGHQCLDVHIALQGTLQLPQEVLIELHALGPGLGLLLGGAIHNVQLCELWLLSLCRLKRPHQVVQPSADFELVDAAGDAAVHVGTARSQGKSIVVAAGIVAELPGEGVRPHEQGVDRLWGRGQGWQGHLAFAAA